MNLETKNTSLSSDLSNKEKSLAEAETKAEKLEQSKRYFDQIFALRVEMGYKVEVLDQKVGAF